MFKKTTTKENKCVALLKIIFQRPISGLFYFKVNTYPNERDLSKYLC
jgi:hypothetical protein